jgi:hypothetical protein
MAGQPKLPRAPPGIGKGRLAGERGALDAAGRDRQLETNAGYRR